MNRNDWLRLSDRNILHIPQITHIKWHDPPPNGEPPDVATVFLAGGRDHIVSHPDEVKVLRGWLAGDGLTESTAREPSLREGTASPDTEAETWPWRVQRNWSNGCEVCPDIFLGQKWVACVTGAPYLGHDSVKVANRIVVALNALKDFTTEEIQRGDWRHDEVTRTPLSEKEAPTS